MRTVAAWVGIGLGFFLAGCGRGKAPALAATADRARVVVVNLSDYEWRIAVTPQRGGPGRAANVAPRATYELAVPAGDYLVEQTALATNLGTESTRHFPLQVAAHQTYRWALATLLSGADDEIELPLETAKR